MEEPTLKMSLGDGGAALVVISGALTWSSPVPSEDEFARSPFGCCEPVTVSVTFALIVELTSFSTWRHALSRGNSWRLTRITRSKCDRVQKLLVGCVRRASARAAGQIAMPQWYIALVREEPRFQMIGFCSCLTRHCCEATICWIMAERLLVRIHARMGQHPPAPVGYE